LTIIDLDDHIGLVKDFLGAAGDFGAGGAVAVVFAADPGPGVCFEQHLVSMGDELPRAVGGQADAVLVNLDLLGYADLHRILPGSMTGLLTQATARRWCVSPQSSSKPGRF
jgi:hypothetical protein